MRRSSPAVLALVLAALALLAEWQQDAALKAAVAGLPEAFAKALTLDWSPLSGRLSRAQSLYVLGRGPGFAIASEAALKFNVRWLTVFGFATGNWSRPAAEVAEAYDGAPLLPGRIYIAPGGTKHLQMAGAVPIRVWR